MLLYRIINLAGGLEVFKVLVGKFLTRRQEREQFRECCGRENVEAGVGDIEKIPIHVIAPTPFSLSLDQRRT